MMYKRCKYCNKRYEYDKQCGCDEEKKARQRQQKYYDTYVRKSKDNIQYYNFYHSKEWEKLSKDIANRHNNLCISCLIERSKAVAYNVVHHIYELRTDRGWAHKLDSDYLIPLCHDCHNGLDYHYTEDKMNELIRYLEEYKRIYG